MAILFGRNALACELLGAASTILPASSHGQICTTSGQGTLHAACSQPGATWDAGNGSRMLRVAAGSDVLARL
jgi:hypothetical protein